MKEEVLFIGGPIDGKRLVVEIMPGMLLPIPSEVPTFYNHELPNEFDSREFAYKFHKLKAGDTNFKFYVPNSQDVTTEMILKRLLDHYKP